MKQLFDVLIIEDNLIDQKLLHMYLSEYDITCLIADRGEEALLMLEFLSFRLLLIDIALPGIDCYNLTHILRKEMNIDTPIVAITTYMVDEVKDKCFEGGMNGCFSKPIGKVELVGMLTQFLPKEKLTSDGSLAFKTINLTYLKEVSLGDLDYEIEITEKFIETIENDLVELKENFIVNDRQKISAVAHRTLSTICIMGLKPKLGDILYSIENNDLTIKELELNLKCVYEICQNAVIEARLFIDEFKV